MKLLSGPIRPSRAVLIALLVVGAVYAVTLSLLPAKGLWVVDNADKFLQMKALAASGYRDYSIPWSGSTIDPDFRYKPIPDPFSYVKHGKMFSFYPPFFPMVSSFFFKAFGFRGLVVLPLLSSLVMLAGVAAIARDMNQGIAVRAVAILVTGLCTPIWFYSVVFWEHTVAACLSVWAICLYLRFIKGGAGRDLVLGSILAAFGAYFREESYLLCLVLAGCAYWWRRPRSSKTVYTAVATLVLALVPLWLFQWKTLGQPLGYHVGSVLFSESGIAGHLLTRPEVLYNHFVCSTPHYWLSFAVGGPFAVAFLLNPRFSRPQYDLAVPIFSAVGLGCSIISLSGYFTSPSAISYMTESANSFLTVAPVLILAFLALRHSDGRCDPTAGARRIWAVALVYSAAYGLMGPRLGSFGTHWANRFLLNLYPLFGLLASINLVEWVRGAGRRRGGQFVVVLMVVLLSLAAQIYSVTLLYKKEDFTSRLNHEIAKRPEQIIVTNTWWAPLEMYQEFSSKTIFLARKKDEFDELLQTLGAGGYQSILFISQVPEAEAAGAVLSVGDNGLNFFTLRFFAVDIRPR